MAEQNARMTRELFEADLEVYRKQIFKVCREILRDYDLAEDATQAAVLHAWLRFDQFRAQASFSTWLTRIARNDCFDLLRKKRCRPAADLAEYFYESGEPKFKMDFVFDPAVDQLTLVSRAEDRRLLREIISSISECNRSCFVLFHVHEFGVSEIAEILSVSENTIKVQLFRGRAQAKRLLLRKGFKLKDFESFLT